jgi:SAM-dependent methyltransferase
MTRLVDGLLRHPRFYRVWARGVDGQKARLIENVLPDLTGARTIDVGCGVGNNCHLFPAPGYLGLDISEEYVRMARRSHPDREFIVADATTQFPSRTFDLVVVNSLLHHLDESQVLAVLGQATRSLSTRGHVVVLEPEIPPAGALMPRVLMRLDRGAHFRSAEHWRGLFTAAGLRVGREQQATLSVCGVTGWHVLAADLLMSEGPPVPADA